MRYFVLPMLLICFFIGCSKTVDKESLNKRNGLWYEVNHTSPYSGKAIVYSISGCFVLDELTFKRGLLHGKQYYYFDNHRGDKKVEAISNYSHGKLHGEQLLYHKSGQLYLRNDYKDGYEHGRLECWYENGQIAGRGDYRNGKKHGWWLTWHENGREKPRELYQNGEFVRSE